MKSKQREAVSGQESHMQNQGVTEPQRHSWETENLALLKLHVKFGNQEREREKLKR